MSQELSIFDLGVKDVISEEEKKKQEAKKNRTQQLAERYKKKEEPPLYVQGDWTIHFATDHFRVDDFVQEIPEEGITLETLREALERHFPQFSAARTKWDVDKENKRLFPDAFAGSKGADVKEGRLAPSFFITAEDAFNEPNKIYRYILSGDGKVLSLHQSIIGTMIAPTNNISKEQVNKALAQLGLSSIKECPITPPSFEWVLPKIPNKFLRQIVGFFRSYIFDDREYEVTLRIYWDMEKKKFVIDCPKQVVTPVNVFFEHSDQYTWKNANRYYPVLEVHSHNVMRAYFSETDNRNEQGFLTTFGVFGVFGRLNREEYEMVFRAKMRDAEVKIKPEQIFDLHVEREDYSFPKHWKANVETREGFYL